MMRTPLVLLTVLIVLATVISAVAAQEPTTSTAADSPLPVPVRSGFDLDRILDDFSMGYLALLLIGAALGGIGGFGAELMGSAAQDVELPGSRTAERRVDIGFWARVILGAISALIALYVVGPQDLMSYIAVSLLGGLFGTAALKLVEGRFIAALVGEQARNDQLLNTLRSGQQEAQALLGLLYTDATASSTTSRDLTTLRDGLVRIDALLRNDLRQGDDEGNA